MSSKTVYVTKADGSLQPYDRSKIISVCLRLHASVEEAEEVADRIEARLYDGIPTREIIEMVYEYLGELKPHLKPIMDLREALGAIRSKPDFEEYVRAMFRELGYETKPAMIVRGECVEHEIDGILSRGGEVLCLEVKHHTQPHAKVRLEELLKLKSVFEDIRRGYERGVNEFPVNRAILVSNAKFSEMAVRYARCVGMMVLGWNTPEGRGIEKLIDRYGLYPVTCLKELSREQVLRLCDAGVCTLKTLVRLGVDEVRGRTGLPKRLVGKMVSDASRFLEAHGIQV